MTTRVATVLSAREWEPELVTFAREHAALRIVLRAFRPDEIEQRSEEIDVVVVGAETAWVTPSLLASWRRSGLRILGVYPFGDQPAADLLRAGGVDELVADAVPIEALVSTIRFLAHDQEPSAESALGTSTAVVGGRGAPGATEVALSLAINKSKIETTVLADLDLVAPSLAVRLGVVPRPDLTDVADAVRATGAVPTDALRQHGRLDVIVGSHRIGEPPLREALAEDVLEALLVSHEHVIFDGGCIDPDSPLLKRADQAVIVVDASAIGVVRSAQLTSMWSGPPPLVVVNRVSGRDRSQVVSAVRQWTGLEPTAVIHDRPAVRAASRAARSPDRRFRRELKGIL